ncbi:MAG TPA: hypothetical protein VE825_16645, partial [Terriglobales bacterium]|nr:hypothetical protein [Terriglobales bacterium]
EGVVVDGIFELVLQVSEMCFTLLTVNVGWVLALVLPEDVAVALELAPAFDPVISTSCPTCSVSFEVSPANW